MSQRQKHHSIDSMFTFLLLLSFCLFSMVLAGMGAAVYKNGSSRLNENYTSRTAIAYVTEKVRQHDSAGDIFLTYVEDIPAMGFRDTVEGDTYITYVYFDGEFLCELFVRDNVIPHINMGSHLVELADLEICDIPEENGGNSSKYQSSLLSVSAMSREGEYLSVFVPVKSS